MSEDENSYDLADSTKMDTLEIGPTKKERKDVKRGTFVRILSTGFLFCLTVSAFIVSVYTLVLFLKIKKTIPIERLPFQNRSFALQSPVYAHKNLINHTIKKADNRTLIVGIDKNVNYREYHEMCRGVKLLEEGIEIMSSGNYFLYKSIYVWPENGATCKELNHQKFESQLVMKKVQAANSVRCLLKSLHTCCPDCADNMETMYAGGIFYLEKGNVISAEISSYEMVNFGSDVSYIGLIMLDGMTV